jgi:alanine dehydrogenase
MKILVINQNEITDLLSMEECMSAMDRAFLALTAGEVLLPLRQVVWLHGNQAALASMPAVSNDSKSMAVKVISVFPKNRNTEYDAHQGAILLFETANGRLLAVLDATEITSIRTAAVSGIATRALARKDASELTILGSGIQAHKHLESMVIARKIKRVRVWSRTPANAERFCNNEQPGYDVPIEPILHPEDAVAGADIICTVTSSRDPVLMGDWIQPGVHINAVGTYGPGARELDTAAVTRSRLFVDRMESALNEAGDFLIPREEGVITDQHILGELGDVLTGKIPGRNSPDEITLFKSLGLAMEDLAAAHHVYEKARQKGAGTSVELGGSRHEA